VIIRGRWRHRLSLEAAVVSSPSSAELAKSSEFNRWLYREIVKLMPINGASIVIDPKPGKTGDARVPPAHRWPVMQKDPSWQVFVGQVRDQGQARWECPEGNISVRFKARQDEYLTAQPLAPARPTDITRHPVYREIRRKARQAKRWPRHLRKRPVVLVICTPGGGREFWCGHDVDDYSIHRAVFSALLDHERMNDLDRINVLRQRLKFRPQHPTGVYVEPNRLRVAGSELISAVLIVRIEQDHGRAAQPPKSTAKPELYFNRHSRHPLPEGLAAEIRKLDFNAIDYGPGWEAWHDTERDSLKVRNLRRGGSLEFRSGKKGETELRIPIMKVLKILSGEATAQKVFAEYGDQPPRALDIFQRALASELTMESINIIDGSSATRAEQQVSFRFGKGEPAVIARTRQRRSPT
jgi:hypothetical protein